MFFNESVHETTSLSKLYSNKLKNMKLHLTELLNKQIRLEVEIKELKRTIKNRQIEYEKNLKVKLSMESFETIEELPRLEYLREDLSLCNSLQEFDKISFEIDQLLNETESEEKTKK